MDRIQPIPDSTQLLHEETERTPDVLELTSLLTALRAAETSALKRHGGHLTLFRFTTGWKVIGATPTDPQFNAVLQGLPAGMSLVDALRYYLDTLPAA